MGAKFAGICLRGALAVLLAIAGPSYSQTLNEAVARAIAVHPEVRTAAANWRAVSESVVQTRAQFLPSLDATLGGGRERTDSPLTRALGSPQTLSRTEARVNLSQLVFDGGAASSELKREQARAASAYGQLASTAESVAFRAAQAFFEVLRLR